MTLIFKKVDFDITIISTALFTNLFYLFPRQYQNNIDMEEENPVKNEVIIIKIIAIKINIYNNY